MWKLHPDFAGLSHVLPVLTFGSQYESETAGTQDTAGFYSIIDYTVDGPQTQQELIEAFARLQERWVRFYPGYKSAHLFASIDGTRVYNIVHWESEAAFREFERVSDNAGRVAAIRHALEGLSGKAEARMSGPPRYNIVREVTPGPRLADG